MQEITISRLAVQTGLRSSTLRYYEQLGLIRSIGRNGLQRVFDPGVLVQLQVIALAKKVGFHLDEIKSMLQNRGNPINKAKFAEKAQQIETRIQELEHLRSTVQHVAQCPYENPLQCEKFQQLLQQI